MKILSCVFSLVELMVTLIVVSILTAAMAPVITKRLKSKEITVSQGGGKGLSMNCQSISPSCGLCEGNACVSCAKSCTENEALDIPNCACKLCNSNDFHGSACLKCDMENCSKCTNGYYLDGGACTICEDGYDCNGTNQNPCPKGYYCKDGITTPCSAGTYKATSSANGTVFVLGVGGSGGSGGSGTHSGGWDGGEFFCGNTGSAGYSGVVIIKIPT